MRYRLWTRIAATISSCAAISISPCLAVNPGFIPGDACFHSLLTDEYLSTLRPATGVLDLNYIYPEPMMLCGYGGFAHLSVHRCPVSIFTSLETVYRAVRKTHPKLVRVLDERGAANRGVEINGLDLFVYNKDVDWKTQKIGLKYNEHWFDFPINSPHPKSGWFGSGNNSERMDVKAYRYVSFLPGADAVVEDWQHSSRYPGLAVRLPDVKGWEFAGPEIESPVVANAEDVELVVTCEPLDEYFRQKEQATFYVIRRTGVRERQWRLSDDGSRIELGDKPLIAP
jgi:hypothetical protein